MPTKARRGDTVKTARLLLLALTVAACGGSVAPTANSAPTAAPTLVPTATATPTPAPTDARTPTPSATPPADTPAPTPTATPTATATPNVSPTPTPLVLPGYDAGVIYFGRERDENTLTIPTPATSFELGQKFYWAFYLNQPFGVRTISLVVARDLGGSESIVISENAEVLPEWHQLSAVFRRRAIRRTGDYVMRFYSGNELIAEGTFTVT